MKKKLFIIICSLLAIAANAQKKKAKESGRLDFSEWAAYYGNGTVTDNISGTNEKKAIGHTIGLIAYLNVPYPQFKEEDKFILGWTARFAAGWNLTTEKAAKYNADIGFWSSWLINKHAEIGLQYSFLGIYAYQHRSFFGSSLESALKVHNLQVSYGRDGQGAFKGCIVPKTKGFNTTTYGIKYIVKQKYFAGFKYTTYPYNKEYSIVLGLISF